MFALASIGVAHGASEGSTLMRHNNIPRQHEHLSSDGENYVKIVGGISETSSDQYDDVLVEQDCNATMGNWTEHTGQQEEQDCSTPSSAPLSAPTLDTLDDNSDPLRIGSIVELYADTSYFATPAIITGQDISSSSIEYSIENVFSNERINNVDQQYVHPYQPYADGTRASCSVGSLRKNRMTPCAVVSHSVREKSGVVIYEVSFVSNDGTDSLVTELLPFSRVRRVHGRQNGAAIA